jgi:hypothetical protein
METSCRLQFFADMGCNGGLTKSRNRFRGTAGQIWRYVAARTAILAYSNLPFLWLFGMRNNILIWATGWHFTTFNNFHRHIGRIATLQAIVHSVCCTAVYFRNDPTGM